jgi:hypothetical protein
LETPEFETTKLQGKKVTMLETVTDKNGKRRLKRIIGRITLLKLTQLKNQKALQKLEILMYH